MRYFQCAVVRQDLTKLYFSWSSLKFISIMGTFILEHEGEILAAMMIYKYNVIIIADVRHYLAYMF